jgi:hypothetical protein
MAMIRYKTFSGDRPCHFGTEVKLFGVLIFLPCQRILIFSENTAGLRNIGFCSEFTRRLFAGEGFADVVVRMSFFQGILPIRGKQRG